MREPDPGRRGIDHLRLGREVAGCVGVEGGAGAVEVALHRLVHALGQCEVGDGVVDVEEGLRGGRDRGRLGVVRVAKAVEAERIRRPAGRSDVRDELAAVEEAVLRLPRDKVGVAQLLDRDGRRAGGRDGATHDLAVPRSRAEAPTLADQSLPGLFAQLTPQLQRLQRDGGQARMLLAGDPEQPGRTVRGTKMVADAVPFDTSHVGPALRQPPQRR